MVSNGSGLSVAMAFFFSVKSPSSEIEQIWFHISVATDTRPVVTTDDDAQTRRSVTLNKLPSADPLRPSAVPSKA